jgi:hypothetical protein
MARTEGLIHRKLPHDAVIHTRQPVDPTATDKEQVSAGYTELGTEKLAEALSLLARQIENRSNVVDEYNSAAITGAGSSASVVVQPTYEYMPEKIESIIITGPTGNVQLQLGDRIWQLSIPATGILTIGYCAIMLSRTDARILTPGTPGVYTLELSGVADRRFQI